ncbi:fused MFS/spermidine synthase [Oxalobacter vibrioformis]|uniref:Fused MFS/spermidine synthase n=1 Tax=Oxalobacter vibrioformis TaxID=933080 RepID=A0A9E9LYJ7_9BURK|nr:fused MFS/spermidine synthase [Oxalobacter vibrioformis]WAW09263.1 fused MFS/spermidine synthase [Oxalobacter vibrioformis]
MRKKKKNKQNTGSGKNYYPKATLSEQDGLLVLHLGTEWIQGAMRINNPVEIVLEYIQQMMMWMLFKKQPAHIVQLGLGSAALTKFCYHNFPEAKVTAVELNPHVINICHESFYLPPDDKRLRVIEGDAMDYVRSQARKNNIDILQVDLYDEHALAPAIDTPEFYKACANCLTPDGMMTVNIFGADSNRHKSLEAIYGAFDAVIWMPEVHGANIVALAFKQAPGIAFSELYDKADIIRLETGLLAKRWVDGLQEWMRQQIENVQAEEQL